jgi:hypothetical protein
MKNTQRKMLNGATTTTNGTKYNADVIHFPSIEKYDEQAENQSRARKLLRILGVLTMANSQQPKESVNYATILLLLAVLGGIGGLYSYTANVNYNYGYERGRNDAEKQQLLKELEAVKVKAENAEKWSIYQGKQEENNKEKKK